MKLSALACLLLCLQMLWGPLCSASQFFLEPLDASSVSVVGESPYFWLEEDDEASGVAPAMMDPSTKTCTYYDVVKSLNLNNDKERFTLVRPVSDHKAVTNVKLDVVVYAILDVDEVGQKLTTYLWTWIKWKNNFIQWKPDDFCGIEDVAVATDTLWKPDIIIQDMIDKDKSESTPYLLVRYNGNVMLRTDQVVVSTCRIRAFKFPFDNQTCDLSFRSASYSNKAIHLIPVENSKAATFWTQKLLRAEYEWIFTELTVRNDTISVYAPQDLVTYSIHMKRRSGLYVFNYILPLLFFFFLDFASFLISDTGDKLGFKITVLLAVTVMQLLFNEILPASSERIPIIAMFCVGIFTLMLLSLVESLVILHLLNKDEKQDQDDPYRRLKDAISLSHNSITSDATLEKAQLSDLIQAALTELLQNKEEEKVERGYWSQKVPTINRVFIVFYITLSTAFLGTIFYLWMN